MAWAVAEGILLALCVIVAVMIALVIVTRVGAHLIETHGLPSREAVGAWLGVAILIAAIVLISNA